MPSKGTPTSVRFDLLNGNVGDLAGRKLTKLSNLLLQPIGLFLEAGNQVVLLLDLLLEAQVFLNECPVGRRGRGR